MAERNPYGAPPRRSDVGGPLIRWTVMLALGAGCVAFARHLMGAELNRAETVQLPEAASPPQFTPTAMETEGDAAGLSAPDDDIASDHADAPSEPQASAPEAHGAPPPAGVERTPAPAASLPITSAVDSKPVLPAGGGLSSDASRTDPAVAAEPLPPPT